MVEQEERSPVLVERMVDDILSGRTDLWTYKVIHPVTRKEEKFTCWQSMAKDRLGYRQFTAFIAASYLLGNPLPFREQVKVEMRRQGKLVVVTVGVEWQHKKNRLCVVWISDKGATKKDDQRTD